MFNNSKKSSTPTRASKPESKVKVHAYYTLPSRGSKPTLDTARRGEKPRKSPLRTHEITRKFRPVVLASVLLLVVLYLIRLDTRPLVIIDTAPSLNREQVYQDGLQRILGESLTSRSKLTLNRDAITRDALDTFPEIESIEMSVALLGARPIAHIREYTLPFIIQSNGVDYLVNQDGVVVGESSDFPKTTPPITIRDESGVELKKGAKVLRSDDAEFIKQAEKLLKSKGRALTAVRLTNIPREAYLSISGISYSVRVYLDDPVLTQIASFFVTERLLGEGGVTPQTYMDVRAGEKIFWQ